MTDIMSERIRVWVAVTHEWVTVEVPASPKPRPRTRKRARKPARPMVAASPESPLPAWWRDTAFYDQGPLADTRTYVKAPAMRTHRAPAVLPVADMGHVIDDGRRK